MKTNIKAYNIEVRNHLQVGNINILQAIKNLNNIVGELLDDKYDQSGIKGECPSLVTIGNHEPKITDSERLDFLHKFLVEKGGIKRIQGRCGDIRIGYGSWHDTLREAIDAEILKEKGE